MVYVNANLCVAGVSLGTLVAGLQNKHFICQCFSVSSSSSFNCQNTTIRTTNKCIYHALYWCFAIFFTRDIKPVHNLRVIP